MTLLLHWILPQDCLQLKLLASLMIGPKYSISLPFTVFWSITRSLDKWPSIVSLSVPTVSSVLGLQCKWQERQHEIRFHSWVKCLDCRHVSWDYLWCTSWDFTSPWFECSIRHFMSPFVRFKFVRLRPRSSSLSCILFLPCRGQLQPTHLEHSWDFWTHIRKLLYLRIEKWWKRLDEFFD